MNKFGPWFNASWSTELVVLQARERIDGDFDIRELRNDEFGGHRWGAVYSCSRSYWLAEGVSYKQDLSGKNMKETKEIKNIILNFISKETSYERKEIPIKYILDSLHTLDISDNMIKHINALQDEKKILSDKYSCVSLNLKLGYQKEPEVGDCYVDNTLSSLYVLIDNIVIFEDITRYICKTIDTRSDDPFGTSLLTRQMLDNMKSVKPDDWNAVLHFGRGTLRLVEQQQ